MTLTGGRPKIYVCIVFPTERQGPVGSLGHFCWGEFLFLVVKSPMLTAGS